MRDLVVKQLIFCLEIFCCDWWHLLTSGGKASAIACGIQILVARLGLDLWKFGYPDVARAELVSQSLNERRSWAGRSPLRDHVDTPAWRTHNNYGEYKLQFLKKGWRNRGGYSSFLTR